MKSLRKAFVVAVFSILAIVPSYAQFSFGPKVGVAVNNLHFNKDVLDTDNRAGFTGGLMLQFIVPVANIGFDASVMYVHRSASLDLDLNGNTKSFSNGRDYIDIPVNLKWMIGLPLVGKIITPYIFTGPSFSFLVSKKDVEDFVENKTCDIAWNLGAGVQLFTKLQIGASYGWGLTKAVTGKNDKIDGKNRYWTITAAYLF